MRRQPNVGVENRLQHLERVAAAREMVRDDQGHKTNRTGAGCADSVAKNALENQRYDDRAPADENCRRIKIRDRWAFLQIHPRTQSEAVDRESQEQKIK